MLVLSTICLSFAALSLASPLAKQEHAIAAPRDISICATVNLDCSSDYTNALGWCKGYLSSSATVSRDYTAGVFLKGQRADQFADDYHQYCSEHVCASDNHYFDNDYCECQDLAFSPYTGEANIS